MLYISLAAPARSHTVRVWYASHHQVTQEEFTYREMM